MRAPVAPLKETTMRKENSKNNHLAAGLARAALVAALLFMPAIAVQKVNAGAEQTIGTTQKMSNGAGLVLLMGLQRG